MTYDFRSRQGPWLLLQRAGTHWKAEKEVAADGKESTKGDTIVVIIVAVTQRVWKQVGLTPEMSGSMSLL